MKSFETSIAIARKKETVWKVLVDTHAWPEWDPNCERVEGTVAPRAKLKVFTKMSPGRAFALEVTSLVENERMVWTGGMPLGLFKGERTFTLEEDGGTTRFVMREEFTGPMLALIGRTIPDLSDAFAAFASGLKERAERLS